MAASGRWPAVDVFICTYNEPLHILEKSIVCAQAIDYPGQVTVWVLDDTRRAWLKDYCAEAGVRYLTRPDNKHAKAGNLNNGLRLTAKETNAPLILVLDADFAPQRNILRRVVGLFRDAKVGVVQTPQFYYNADPIQYNLHAENSWVDDQRVFFDIFQPAKDARGCAFCVGTSFVVRRDLLDMMGGFPTGVVCEDIWLTYSLLRHGFETRWLNERLSVGLSAEGMADYATQRARWCLGTVQVALLRDGPFLGRGYKLRHRLHYLHGLAHWFCKPFLAMVLLAPAFYWLLGLPAFHADYLSFLRYGVPSLLAFWIWSAWISGGRSLPLFTEVTHAVVSLPISAALVSAVLRPFGRPFKVTPKGLSRDEMVVNWGMAAAFASVLFLTGGGVAWTLLSPDGPIELPPEDILNLVWAGVALVMSFACLLVCCERPRPNSEERFAVSLAGAIKTPAAGGEPRGCAFEHLSVADAALRLHPGDPAREGDAVQVFVPEVGWVRGRVAPGAADTKATVALDPDAAQRRALVRLLFSQAGENVASEGRMLGALRGFARRAVSPT
jgi:cellulose synthase (UDP-forming)